MTGRQPILVFEGVSKRYGDIVALNGVDLSIDRGEVVCLIGPSGSGKSTLLRCANALDPLDSGRVLFEGQEVRSADPKAARMVRRRMGMVFQNFELFPHLTVLQNITIGPRTVLKLDAAAAEKRAHALLDKVLLATGGCIRGLSGGQQRRVASPGRSRHGAGADALRRADLGARSGRSAKC
jgi:polar amino acid transport system ATP-binding protein